MSESIPEKVQRFIDFNQSMIASAMTEENRKDQSIHSKVLLCSIFDSLAKSRFPRDIRNGERFKRTVVEYAVWADCERVSLLHLIRALEVAGTVPHEFESLQQWARAEFLKRFPPLISNRLSAVESPISQDPLLSEVQSYWPGNAKIHLNPRKKVRLTDLQHKNLLWLYRNSLVHEYRIPGCGAESITKLESDPYYQQVALIEEYSHDTGIKFTKRWELVYPTGFFLQLTQAALTNIAEFHQRKASSPFAAYSEGSYWIPEFNEE